MKEKKKSTPAWVFLEYHKDWRRPKHEKAMRLLVWLLHQAGFRVNWDKAQCYTPLPRAEDLPLYLITKHNRRRVDIVFELDSKTLVAIEVSTWKKEKLTNYRYKKLMKRAERHLGD